MCTHTDNTQRERETDRQTDRHTERQRETETERRTHRQSRDTQTHLFIKIVSEILRSHPDCPPNVTDRRNHDA